MSLEFPKTRCSLWDKTSVGPPVLLHISNYRRPRVCVPEKIIKLVQHQCENYGQSSHILIGSLVVDDDGEGVQIQIDRLDTRTNVPMGSLEFTSAGNVCICLQVTNNSSTERTASVDDYTQALKALQERCCSKDNIDLCAFFTVIGWGSFYSNAHTALVHLDFDVVTMETTFKSTPITPVPIAVTALSKNLASPRSLSSLQGTAKTGYLTMDHTRKLLLVLESDPKTAVLPVVGIWVSGVEFIHHPFVWAACLRYIHNTHLQDRVCSPPEEFLLVLYTSLHSRPEFYQCDTSSGSASFQFELSSGHEVVNMDKVLGSPGSGSFIEVNMEALKSGHKMEVFEAAKLKHMATAELSGNYILGHDDLQPRCAPTPHAEKVPLFQPMVPDVSVLWTESYENLSYPVASQRKIMNESMLQQPQQLTSPQHFIPTTNFPLQNVATPAGGSSNVKNTPPLQTHPLLSQNYTPARPQMYPPFAQSGLLVPESSHLYSPLLPQPSQFIPPTAMTSFNKPSMTGTTRMSGALDHHRLDTLTVMSTQTHNLPLAHTANSPHQFNFTMAQHSNTHQLAGSTSSGPAQYQPSSPGSGSSTPGRHLSSQSPVTTSSQHMQPAFNKDGSQHRSTLRTIAEEAILSPSSSLHAPDQLPEQESRNAAFSINLTNIDSTGISVNPTSTIHSNIPFSYKNANNSSRPFIHPTLNNNVSPFTHSSINNSVNSFGYPINNSSPYQNTNVSNRSASEDSGIGFTPDRYGKPLPGHGTASTVPALSLPPIATSTVPTNIPASTSIEPSIDGINWEQIPTELRALFLQQNELLKQLQQQIQVLQSQQMAQSHQVSAARVVSEETSGVQKPSVKYCSVAVNTTFMDDPDGSLQDHKLCGCKPPQVTPAKVTRPNFTSIQTDIIKTVNSKITHPQLNPGFEVSQTENNTVLMNSNTNHLTSKTQQGGSDTSQDEVSPRDLDSIIAGVGVCDPTLDSNVSDLGVSMPDYVSSVNDRSQPDNSPTSVSDYYRQNQEDLNSTVGDDAADPRQYYSQLMKNIQMFLTNSGSQDSISTLPPFTKSETVPQSPTKKLAQRYDSPANSLLIPDISSMSMLLGYGTDTCQSMEINALAMKYLSDEQLTHMAKLRQLAPSSSHRSSYSAKILQQVIGNYRYSAEDATPDVSRLGISPNDMTLATQKYLEKHGLLGNDLSALEFPTLGNELQLKTDFSLLSPESVADGASFNITTNARQHGYGSETPHTSPTKNFVPARSSSAVETPDTGNNENWLPDKRRLAGVSKNLGASPLLPARKDKLISGSSDRGQNFIQDNVRQRNILQEVQPLTLNVKPGQTITSRGEGDNEENLLDIQMLKQMPKLL